MFFTAKLAGFFFFLIYKVENVSCCIYTCVCLSYGPIFMNNATTKAAFQGYPHRAASVCLCCNNCFSCSHFLALFTLHNFIVAYTSELYLPVPQCWVSHPFLGLRIPGVFLQKLLFGWRHLKTLGFLRNNTKCKYIAIKNTEIA